LIEFVELIELIGFIGFIELIKLQNGSRREAGTRLRSSSYAAA